MPKIETARANYLGIDPGQSGGLVSFFSGSITATPMPETDRDVWDWFQLNVLPYPSPFAVIEKVHSMPKQGVASSFTFGRGYGFLRGCLTAAGVPFEEVSPQAWMKALGIPTVKGESKPERKNRLRAIAQQLFPQLELWNRPKSKGVQLAVADALLIAEYCRRKHRGTL